jgi:cytidylate kinase
VSRHYVIAVDGPSASGKSSLAKDLADQLKFVFVDTGAMYRAVTLSFIRNHTNIESPESVENTLKSIEVEFKIVHEKNTCFLNGENVESLIRSSEISEYVSKVSALSQVREAMVSQQRKMAENSDLVMDGRDIGTVVFPNADIKFFITASLSVRSMRRYKDAIKVDPSIALGDVTANLQMRDYTDSNRENSPLRKANDAIEIDNSDIDRVDQLNMVLGIVRDKLGIGA